MRDTTTLGNHTGDARFGSQIEGGSIFSGTRWTAVNQIGTQVIKFGVAIILARLLVPQDFGLMAMAIVVVGFIDLFKDLGTVAAIIQRKELSYELLSSLFFLNALFGLLAGVTIAFSAPVVGWVYGDPRLTPILQVLAVTFPVSSLGLVKRALLEREMRFDRLARVELTATGIRGAAAVAFAFLGWGVWALVGGTITGSVVSTMLLWLVVPWNPQFRFKWSEVRMVFHFSLNLTGSQLVRYVMLNTDKIIIGRFLGATPLGFYSLAQRIFMTPIGTITNVLSTVLFPGFSRIQDDDVQIRQKYLRACGGISLITFPLLAGLWAIAPLFVLVVFGSKWAPVIPLIMILIPVGIIQSIANTVGIIYLAKGRTDWLFIWEVIAGTCITLSFICGLHWGIIGVASAFLIAMILLTYPAFAIPFRLIDLKFMELVSTLRPYAVATLIMVSLVLGFRFTLEQIGFEPLSILIFCVIIGVVVYTAIILLTRPQGLADFQKMFFLKDLVRRSA
jgi:PST family polysaccharide transporter